MALSAYVLKYFDCDGNFKFTLEDIISLEYGRTKNDLGVAAIKMAGNRYDFNDFTMDSRLEIWRSTSDGNSILKGETCWFLVKVEKEINSNCDEIITLTFYDTITLLSRRVVAFADVLNPNYASVIRERLDDIVSLIAYYNFGGGTTALDAANTNISGFTPSGPFGTVPAIASWQLTPYSNDLTNRQYPITIGTPRSQSSITTQTLKLSTANLLTAMQEIAESSALQGESLWFDIVYTPATPSSDETFTFLTWVGVRGTDRTQSTNRMTFGPYYKNVGNVKVTRDWTEYANVGYVSGQGDVDQKSFAGVVSPEFTHTCPFDYIEVYESGNSGQGAAVHQTADLVAEANILLAQHRVIDAMEGDILNASPYLFDEDYFYGDNVLISIPGYQRSVEIAEFKITVDSGGEKIDIPFSVT